MKFRAALRVAAFAAALAAPLAAAQWRMQFLYGEDGSFVIKDICFASPRRGVAVGFVAQGKRIRPMSVVTADGGAHWNRVPLKEPGLSLFFLDETAGWMVTPNGIWRTSDAGRNWSRLPNSPKRLLRVYFRDAQRGWAVGHRNGAYETRDGGQTWARLPAAAGIKANPEYSAFRVIAFSSPQDGIIVGANEPPRRGEARDERRPEWLAPEGAGRRTELPHLSLGLRTRDGGETWAASTESMFGRITRVRYGGPARFGLWLTEFANAFAWPSEVTRINSYTGGSDRVYREKNRAVTDIAIAPDGTAYLAAIDIRGTLRGTSGKLAILSSRDFQSWQEAEVDYRATGARAMLAGAGADLWAATDEGAILRLAP